MVLFKGKSFLPATAHRIKGQYPNDVPKIFEIDLDSLFCNFTRRSILCLFLRVPLPVRRLCKYFPSDLLYPLRI